MCGLQAKHVASFSSPVLLVRRARDQKKRRLGRREWNLVILECFEHALYCHWLGHVTAASWKLSKRSCYFPIGRKELHSSEFNLRSDDGCFMSLLSQWNKKLTEIEKLGLYKLKTIEVKLFFWSTVYIVKLQWYFYKEKKIQSKNWKRCSVHKLQVFGAGFLWYHKMSTSSVDNSHFPSFWSSLWWCV